MAERKKLQAELEDTLNKPSPRLKTSPGGDFPPVAEPAMFRNKPIVVNDELRAIYEQLLGMFPELAGGINTISSAPTNELIDDYLDRNFDPQQFRSLNTTGIHDAKRGEIFVSPGSDDPSRTLVHELTHSRNPQGGEKEAYKVGNLYRQFLNKK